MLDRAPLSNIPQSHVGTFYRHLKTMAMLVKKKENEYQFRLSPGTVMIIDNWRLLHGRGSYRGERVLKGCYYSRSDFMSKARHYGIIS
jgi:alpha-ketoglutarate-dependent taurine dioxygenase